MTALMRAAHSGRVEAVKALVDANADVNAMGWVSAGAMDGWWEW